MPGLWGLGAHSGWQPAANAPSLGVAGPEADPRPRSWAGEAQKHRAVETSVPKPGPKRLSLPQRVCMGVRGHNQTGTLE